MRKRLTIAAGLLLAGLALGAAEVEQNETIQKTYALAGAAAKKIVVDNVNGSIRVTGYAGGEIRLVAHKRLRADSPETAEQARRDVKLDITQDANSVRFYVDGPFRCRDGGIHIDRDPDYEVKYDFELQVPHDTAIDLKTVNDGEIKVEDVAGDYKVDNINGGVEMTELSGSGKIYALNGKVKVSFRENPRAKSSFGSLNGEVRVSFQPDLNADVRFKTFNGQVFTDYQVTYLPLPPAEAERHGAKYVYKSSEWSAVRVGHGGPELSFDAFNGNIRILNRGQ
jgi:putative adhesin